MAEESAGPVAAPVSDHRPVPRGVLPRRFQTWLMAGLALGIVLIILITGQPEPSRNPAQSQPAPVAPNPDRLRDYQERLRAMEARQSLEGQPAQPAAPEVPRFEQPTSPAPEDPIAADRKRREYESLFASKRQVAGRRSMSRVCVFMSERRLLANKALQRSVSTRPRPSHWWPCASTCHTRVPSTLRSTATEDGRAGSLSFFH